MAIVRILFYQPADIAIRSIAPDYPQPFPHFPEYCASSAAARRKLNPEFTLLPPDKRSFLVAGARLDGAVQ